MKKKSQIELAQVLANNPLQPIMIIGYQPDNWDNAVYIMGNTDERELHIPSLWHKELDNKAAKGRTHLIVADLEKVSKEEQNKFAGLLKDRRAGNYKLPNNAQIIIPVNDKNKISAKIQSLCLVWEVK